MKLVYDSCTSLFTWPLFLSPPSCPAPTRGPGVPQEANMEPLLRARAAPGGGENLALEFLRNYLGNLVAHAFKVFDITV